MIFVPHFGGEQNSTSSTAILRAVGLSLLAKLLKLVIKSLGFDFTWRVNNNIFNNIIVNILV